MSRPCLVMTLLVRDEDDIVRENVVWHLAQGVDHIIATDNGSTDETRSILAEFAEEGVLTLLDEPAGHYVQGAWNTRMALMARDVFGADWVFCNDADEFWRAPSGDLHDVLPGADEPQGLLACPRVNLLGPRDALGTAHWSEVLTLRPIDPPGLPGASRHSSGMGDVHFDRSYFEYAIPPKLLMPTAGLEEVHRGSHDATYAGGKPQVRRCPIEILHFPVRSREEFAVSVRRIGNSARNTPGLGVTASWKYRRWLEMTEAAGSIWPAFREALPDRRAVADGLESGRLVHDRSLLHTLRRLGVAHSAPGKRGMEESHMNETDTRPASSLVPAPLPVPAGGALTLVLGADPQSIDSATGLISRLGAATPSAAGRMRLEAVHAAILTEMGLEPDAPGSAPREWSVGPDGQAWQIELHGTVRSAFAEMAAGVVGDVNLGRLLSLWRGMADTAGIDLGAVIVVSSPLEAAQAWSERTGLPVSSGAIFWAMLMLEAERASRGLPRVIATERDIARDWRTCADRLEATLEPGWLAMHRVPGPEIDDWVARRGRAADDEAHIAATPVLSDLVRETYDTLDALAAGADDGRLAPVLDALAARLEDALAVLSPTLSALHDAQARWPRRMEAADRRGQRRAWRAELLILCRDKLPVGAPRGPRGRLAERRAASTLRAAPEFDADWYRARYPDVAAGGADPVLHYLRHGAREGRNPGPAFDTLSYYAANLDILEAGQNALLHFVRHGRDEGRAAAPAGSSDI